MRSVDDVKQRRVVSPLVALKISKIASPLFGRRRSRRNFHVRVKLMAGSEFRRERTNSLVKLTTRTRRAKNRCLITVKRHLEITHIYLIAGVIRSRTMSKSGPSEVLRVVVVVV